jgi:uncharacterized SAM-binding protein YcdF (DUF218 family)
MLAFTKHSRGSAAFLGAEVHCSLARAAASLLGCALLFNALVGLLANNLDAAEWIIDLRGLSGPLRVVLLLACGLAFTIAGLSSKPGRYRVMALRAAAGFMVLVACIDIARFYKLLASSWISSELPVPFSLFVAGIAAWLGLRCWSGAISHPHRVTVLTLAVTPVWLVLFLLGQVVLFGSTNYARKADAIVVLGARVYANGTPSLALEDRVGTGVRLYNEGLAPRLIMSGGPGDGRISEPVAMKTLAESLGVPSPAILLDEGGLNTEKTAEYLAKCGRPLCVLAVSHDYHLARVKIAFERRGIRVSTVPADESRMLTRKPLFIAREVVALGVYYIRPMLRAIIG